MKFNKPILLFIPTIIFAVAYLLSRQDLAMSTTVANMALPTLIIQMLLIPVVAYWIKKKKTNVAIKKKSVLAIAAIGLVLMISSLDFASAGMAGSLLDDPAYIHGNVKVYISTNLDSYAFLLTGDSAIYFKNQAQRATNDAVSYIGIIGGGTVSGFLTNWLVNWLKLPAKYNPLGALIAGVTTGLTITKTKQMNDKIQQCYSPTNGIALSFSHSQVQIYNWYGWKWETLYKGDEYVSYACNKMAGLYGTGDWATYYGCEIISM